MNVIEYPPNIPEYPPNIPFMSGARGYFNLLPGD
jgi:hypothetical protein